MKTGLNENQLRLLESFGGGYPTVTSAIRSLSEETSLPESTARWNFNALARKGLVDRDKLSLTNLGLLVLDLVKGECLHTGHA